MLTWGALHVIGAKSELRAQIDRAQQAVFDVIDKEITKLGVEHDEMVTEPRHISIVWKRAAPKPDG